MVGSRRHVFPGKNSQRRHDGMMAAKKSRKRSDGGGDDVKTKVTRMWPIPGREHDM